MILPLAKVLAIAAQCGAVSVSQLIALPGQLQQESGYDSTAINDNTLGRSFHPANLEDAVAFVRSHRGDSLDVGLLQINNTNWRRLGLDAVSVFDPVANVCAGLQVLKAGLSIYNTGRISPRGLAYAARVLTADPKSQQQKPADPPREAAPKPDQDQFGVENDDEFSSR
jgi:hypothetical protein